MTFKWVHCSIDGLVKQLAQTEKYRRETENGAEKKREWLPKLEQKKAGNQSVPHQKIISFSTSRLLKNPSTD